MGDLKFLYRDSRFVTDSREVAELIGKDHKELLRSIRYYSKTLSTANLKSLDFFIPHYYGDEKNEKRPCFLLTKKGCDLIINKMTGERGIIFTAEYTNHDDKIKQMGHVATALLNLHLMDPKNYDAETIVSKMFDKFEELELEDTE